MEIELDHMQVAQLKCIRKDIGSTLELEKILYIVIDGRYRECVRKQADGRIT